MAISEYESENFDHGRISDSRRIFAFEQIWTNNVEQIKRSTVRKKQEGLDGNVRKRRENKSTFRKYNRKHGQEREISFKLFLNM